tara:strand:+ start:49 stop:1035 length:987 start_codon:yes stop_codon:yes gene_type:complete
VNSNNKKTIIQLTRQRSRVWLISTIFITLSIIGILFSLFNPSIKAPLNPGLDFTGGTQITLERLCSNNCSYIDTSIVSKSINDINLQSNNNDQKVNLSGSRVQILDDSKSILIRLPFLSSIQVDKVIDHMTENFGPFDKGGLAVDTIGPTLGVQLLKSSLISLIVAFSGIAIYISIRYDTRYSLLALLALAHDILIVCGLFAWLGVLFQVEVDSLFAVSLLTIAGYSVNNTVVVFDRIRERSKIDLDLSQEDQIDRAVSATLTRTLYTSLTTLMPLISLMLFGGTSLYWFSLSLSLGVIVGGWSSIALAPTLLTLLKSDKKNLFRTNI